MKYGMVAAVLLVPGIIALVQTPIMAKEPAQAGTSAAQQSPAPSKSYLDGAGSPVTVVYPDRPKAPQEVLDRGKATYGVSCAFCHGSDAAGGEVGPNLLRSDVVLNDQNGEMISPIVHGARVANGMPRIDLTDAQVSDIAAWLHSIRVVSRTGPPPVPINIVVGDASAGKTTFEKTCGSCHSVTGDLKGFATRFPNPRAMQQIWLLPDGGGSRVPGAVAKLPKGLDLPPATVTVTLANGSKVEGELLRVDDFYVGLREKDGNLRGFSRDGEVPKVELHDPLAPHRELLRKYTDKQIHDITAYLVTIK